MIKINSNILFDESEIKYKFIRSEGPGGQNVNKVETAVQCRFNVKESKSLPASIRLRLLSLASSKITHAGELIFKANRFRTQGRNKQDAKDRIIALIKRAATLPKKRLKTKPSRASIESRIQKKKQHAKVKSLRRKKIDHT